MLGRPKKNIRKDKKNEIGKTSMVSYQRMKKKLLAIIVRLRTTTLQDADIR